ncbi:hypothetical protein HU200_002018 [Digitaria exilis]|uniref:Uncharacterized protein n=1 Tax=Digitaria exilis TaxID=1010633 RepID=A0A835KVX3_9POAL|nr:hypothetical protein HU200_002018 [Digitaria exilis]
MIDVYHVHVHPPVPASSIDEWWKTSLRALSKQRRRVTATIFIYTTWNLWKEKKQTYLQRVEVTALQIQHFIREQMGLRRQACGCSSVP